MIKNSLFLAPLLAATAAASGFSYTQLDLGYMNGNAELPTNELGDYIDKDLDIEGFFIAGRYEITNNFFAYAKYENGEIKLDTIEGRFDIDTLRLEAGIGSYVSMADSADAYFTVGYKFTQLKEFGEKQKIGNIDLSAGIRWAPASWIEINPYVSQSIGVRDDDFVDATDVSTIGLNVYVTAYEHVQPFAGISYDFHSTDDYLVDDLVLFSCGLRFSF